MLNLLGNMHPVVQALLATCFTWGVTSLGAAAVFLSRQPSRKTLDGMLGFAGGVMIAASYWSLLAPAIELSQGQALPSWLPPAIGFLLGGLFLRVLDLLLPHLHRNLPRSRAEGIKTHWPRSTLFVLAVTLHNIPEGLAVGVAFGAAGAGLEATGLAAAIALALGIGLQNFPEGVAVSMPLRRDGLSRRKSFWYGQLSGFVEVVAGVIGAAAVLHARPILPYALAFAAGAMIFVVIEEVVPETQQGDFGDFATLCAMLGFVAMMTLDVGLG
jgi:ZIP family zinc transporter